MDYDNGFALRCLADLLNSEKRVTSEDSDDDMIPRDRIHNMGPGSIQAPKNEVKVREVDTSGPPSPEIWKEEEVKNEEDDELELKGKPEYELFYKQNVTAEEVFLQMGNKKPTSASCENTVVKVNLPGTQSLQDINLKVSKEILDCSTSRYKLKLPLPNPVNPEKSRAEWNQQRSVLVVTLFNNREFDILNF